MIIDNEMPAFLSDLQQLGITLDTYEGAYNNVSHPNANGDTQLFNSSVEQSPKRQRLDSDATSNE